jgi:Beta-galactosidase C-terminal domain
VINHTDQPVRVELPGDELVTGDAAGAVLVPAGGVRVVRG